MATTGMRRVDGRHSRTAASPTGDRERGGAGGGGSRRRFFEWPTRSLSPLVMRCDPWLRPLARLPYFQDVLDELLRREADARAAFQAAGGDRVLA
jgi:hypothetical protein